MRGSSAFQTILTRKMFVAKILWLAITLAMFMYAAVGYIVAMNQGPMVDAGQAAVMRYALYAAGVLTALSAIWLRLFLFSRERLEARLKGTIHQAVWTPQGSSGRTGAESLSESEQRIIGLFSWYFVRYIIVLAFNESVAILGLVLAMLSGRPVDILPFLAASLFLNALMFTHPGTVIEDAELAVWRGENRSRGSL